MLIPVLEKSSTLIATSFYYKDDKVTGIAEWSDEKYRTVTFDKYTRRKAHIHPEAVVFQSGDKYLAISNEDFEKVILEYSVRKDLHATA